MEKSVKRKSSLERRKYDRYITDESVQIYVKFKLEEKLSFRIKRSKGQFSSGQYEGINQNVSVEGLCFGSDQKLKKGDAVLLEINVPSRKPLVSMEGKVKWSRLPAKKEGRKIGV